MRAALFVVICAILMPGHAQTRLRPEVNDLIQRGNLARQRAQESEALTYYRQALEQARALNDSGGEAAALHALGVALISQGRPQEAISYLNQALQRWQTLKDSDCEANTLHNLGVAYTNLGKPREALAAYERALSLRRALQQRHGEATTLQGIALVYFGLYDTKQAQHYFEQALKIWDALDNKPAQAETLRYIGQLYQASGQWHAALASYEKALALCQEVRSPDLEAKLLASIASLYLTLGQPELALNYYHQALELRQTEDNPREMVITHLGLGHLYVRTGQVEKARQHYEKALELSRAARYERGEVSALNALGNLLADKEPAQAETLYRQAYARAQALGDTAGQAGAQANLGLLYARTQRPNEARQAFETALALYTQLGDPRGEMYVLSNLGTLAYNQNDLDTAIQHYLAAIDRAEKIREQIGALTEGRLSFQAERQSLYTTTIALLARAKRTEEAFLLTQRAKGRTLSDLMDAGRVSLASLLTPEEREQERMLRFRVDRANQNLLTIRSDPNADPAVVEQFREEARQAERELQAFLDRVAARLPALAASPHASPTLQQIADALPPQSALLEYLAIPTSKGNQSVVLVFCLTKEKDQPRLSVHQITLQKPLGELTEAFVLTCATPEGKYEAPAREMHRLLLGPVQGRIASAKTLIICPDVELWDVPFQALLNTQGFLWEQYTLIYAPSASIAVRLREVPNRPRPEKEMLMVANPQFGMLTLARADEARPLTAGSRPLTAGERPLTAGERPLTAGERPITAGERPITAGERPITAGARPITAGARPITAGARPITAGARDITGQYLAELGVRITPLPGTEQEAQRIAPLFPDHTLFKGADAQEATLKAEMGKYRYLHLATHGYFNDATPLQSGLVLAEPAENSGEDGILTARELMEIPLSAEMVVLSACESARGQARPGEGTMGMVWALSVCGVPVQILSQWKVSDESTALLMSRFYALLKQGLTPEEALRRAGLEVKQDPRFQHPYYWAPFIRIGAF